MKPFTRVLTLTLALSTFRCEGPLGPSTLEDFLFEEFEIAMCRLEPLNLRGLDKVEPYDFLFIPHDNQVNLSNCGAYSLNGALVHGHFHPPREIHYAKNCPQVLRHEFGHAILYVLNNPYWRCWEHFRDFEGGVERFQNCPLKYLKPQHEGCPL